MFAVFLLMLTGTVMISYPLLSALGLWPVWGMSLVLFIIGISSYAVSMTWYRRLRMVRDTATSKIGSLPVGFVEVYGKAKRLEHVHSIYHNLTIKEVGRSVASAKTSINRDEFTIFPFYIEDGTGKVFVDPADAKIIVDTRRWSDGDYYYTEAEIKEGDYVYCLGTVENRTDDITRNVNEALKAARKDKNFVKKYDLNEDGKISQQEWEEARKKITSEVIQNSINSAKKHTKEIRKGENNKVFIISNKSEHELTKGLLKKTLFMFFSGVIFIVAALVDLLMETGFLPESVKGGFLEFFVKTVDVIWFPALVIFCCVILFFILRSALKNPKEFLIEFLKDFFQGLI